MKNVIEVDWTDNPDLADVFRGKKAGDDFELRVKGKLIEMDDEGMKGSIDTVVVTQQGKKEQTVDTAPEEPVMMVMRGKPEEPASPDQGQAGMQDMMEGE